LVAASVALVIGVWSVSAAGAPVASSASWTGTTKWTYRGTYRGKIRCLGSDRFSNGAPTRHYRSRPKVSVSFGASQRLRRWTYLFLGRKNLVIHTRAVRVGESFTYAAGAHIGRPGRTRVTVTDVERSPGGVLLVARLDWASPSTGYIGSGTYVLVLELTGPARVNYEAVKVVVKQPRGPASAANPVVRRNELCIGELTR
jgi:hypothetical protein